MALPPVNLEERIATCCIHFNGISNDECKAGVRYDSFPESKKLPCVPMTSNPKPAAFCLKRQFPTPAQVEVEIQKMKSISEEMKLINPIIMDMKIRHKGTGGSQVVACPKCGGKLSMTISPCNNHTRGRCSTPGCYCWLE